MASGSDKLKILFATQSFPYPPDAGYRIRMLEVLKALSGAGTVTLLTPPPDERPEEYLAAVRPYCGRIVTTDLDVFGKGFKPARTVWQRAGILLSSTLPVAVRRARLGRKSDGLFERLLAEHDVCWVVHYRTAEAYGASGSKVILDSDDIEHRMRWRHLRVQPWWGSKWYEYTDLAKLVVYERRMARRYRYMLVASERDRLYLKHDNLRVVPNGANVPAAYNTAGDGRTILYYGLMSYPPNADAALFFAREILPAIRRQCPDARFVIGGAEPTPEVRRLDGEGGIEVRGFIRDLDATLAEASVVAVPLRAAAGTRLKILESMAHGKSVVSTTVGAEGIPALDGQEFLLRDKPADFAEACAALLKDPARRREMGEKGRLFVQKTFTWEAVAKTIQELVSSMAPAAARASSIGAPQPEGV